MIFNNDCAVLWNDGVSVCCSVMCIKNNIYITQFKAGYNGSSKFINNNAELNNKSAVVFSLPIVFMIMEVL